MEMEKKKKPDTHESKMKKKMVKKIRVQMKNYVKRETSKERKKKTTQFYAFSPCKCVNI